MNSQARAKLIEFARKTECVALKTSPLVTGLSILAFGAAAALYAHERTLSEERARLLRVEAGMAEVVESRLATVQRAIEQLQGVYKLNSGAMHAPFHRFVKTNDGLTKATSFVAMSYGVVSGGRGQIAEIAPSTARSQFVRGADSLHDRQQKVFVEHARDSGLPVLATLPRTGHSIIYAPLYRGGNVPANLNERRAAFSGWFAAEIDARSVFAAAVRHANTGGPIVAMDALELSDARTSRALFASADTGLTDEVISSALKSETSVAAIDRIWTLRTRALPGFRSHTAHALPMELFLASMALSACVSSFLSLAKRRNVIVERSERQLRLVMNSAPAMIAYLGAGRECLFANKTFGDWFGDARSDESTEVSDCAAAEQGAPPGAAERLLGIASAFSTRAVSDAMSGKQIAFESMVEVNGRGQRALRIELAPDIRPDGVVAGFVFLATDLTDEREAREGLREETRALELVIEAGVRLRQELDADKIIQVVTESALAVVSDQAGDARALFLTPPGTDCFEGRQTVVVDDLTTDAEWSGFEKPFGEMRASGAPARSLLISPVASREGRLFGKLAIVANVTHAFRERHVRIVDGLAAQAAVALDNARLFKDSRQAECTARRWAGTQTFLAHAGEALASSLDFMQDLDGLARLATPRIADWCSVEIFDKAGDLRLACVSHSDRERIEGALRFRARFPANRLGDRDLEELLSSGRTQYRPAPAVPPAPLLSDDPEYVAFVRGLGIHSFIRVALKAGGKVFGVLTLANAESKLALAHEDVALAEDLARRISMSRENARLYREAREINRVKDEFLATLSHELRTPLNVIQGHSELLHDEAPDLGDLNDSVDAIWRNACAQTRIVNDLLDVSAIITGKVTMRLERISVASAVRAAVDSIRFSAQAKNLTIEARIPDATSGAGRLEIDGDPARIQQILSNLLSNAVKFAREAGTVICSVREDGSHCRISIHGDGQGIDPEFLPHVFERFRQEDSSLTRRYGGLGLGLSIVQHLTELHGGTVEARSEGRGRGAEFVVLLPLARPDTVVETEVKAGKRSGFTDLSSGGGAVSAENRREARG